MPPNCDNNITCELVDNNLTDRQVWKEFGPVERYFVQLNGFALSTATISAILNSSPFAPNGVSMANLANLKPKKIRTVAFVSLGCPKNLVDSERMLGLLAEDGLAITADATHRRCDRHQHLRFSRSQQNRIAERNQRSDRT